MKRVFITGTAGFIGFHLARHLLAEGHIVHGFDGITDYYDITLKQRRHAILMQNRNFAATEAMLEDQDAVAKAVRDFAPDIIVHLAAQAGVRYSIDNPRSYLEANIIGTFNVMEAALEQRVEHLLMASTSSVYGANEQMPYREVDKTDAQMSFYAASKKATESMAHSYAHIHDLPITMFRTFTAYGPWGRPDMALFKFTDAILDDRPIDIYNHGRMMRDFTYVDDLVKAISLLMEAVPVRPQSRDQIEDGDSLSPVAPYRTVNIGNATRVQLLDFIEAIEAALGKKAIRNMMEIQQGDVPATLSDSSLLHHLTGYKPATTIEDGVKAFVAWFRDYYNK
ncbi:SDR family NAD(P)-dependent oxidoreductase [Cohaesibacter intestini]|uniref:SDR family NAD(P)-dependent oxidoreductase n=1 Tax=Cohaesibacter intestini TaxID=2211145 RepID=UPI000DEA691B|nr:SDR family NAD(P)-dependent oxidoreductase [Cohaesibacter intestini]